jgi:hypothetical protein
MHRTRKRHATGERLLTVGRLREENRAVLRDEDGIYDGLGFSDAAEYRLLSCGQTTST